MTRWRYEATYSYVRPRDGREIFQRVKYRNVDDPTDKKVVYRHQCDPRSQCSDGWHWTKPEGADGYLYRLPEVLAGLQDGVDIWWAEGEKDADALAAAGVVATSHHQGAEVGANLIQARWLAGISGAARIVLVADRDEAGAWDVVRRYDLLLAVGVPTTRLVVVRGHGPVAEVKDAADHLAAGRGIRDFVVVPVDRARETANRHRPPGKPRQAYRPGKRWGG